MPRVTEPSDDAVAGREPAAAFVQDSTGDPDLEPAPRAVLPAPHQRLGYKVAEFARRIWVKGYEDDIFFMAGAVAFNLLVAVVPLLILFIGVTGYVLSARVPDPADAVLRLTGEFLPGAGGGVDLTEVIRGVVDALIEQRGNLTLFGAGFFVWVATRLAGSIRSALREIFDVGRARGIIEGKIFDVKVVIVGVLLLTLNLGITLVFSAVFDLGVGVLGIDGTVGVFAQYIFGYLVSVTSIWLLFVLVYRYLPARRIPWRTSLVAGTFSAVFHEVLKAGFTWYATEVADYGSTFGNLANVAVLFFWIYYEAVVFILGAELAQVYTMRRSARVTGRTRLTTHSDQP